jgi:hypothetical protein
MAHHGYYWVYKCTTRSLKWKYPGISSSGLCQFLGEGFLAVKNVFSRRVKAANLHDSFLFYYPKSFPDIIIVSQSHQSSTQVVTFIRYRYILRDLYCKTVKAKEQSLN